LSRLCASRKVICSRAGGDPTLRAEALAIGCGEITAWEIPA
jgi:hypothetical protein